MNIRSSIFFVALTAASAVGFGLGRVANREPEREPPAPSAADAASASTAPQDTVEPPPTYISVAELISSRYTAREDIKISEQLFVRMPPSAVEGAVLAADKPENQTERDKMQATQNQKMKLLLLAAVIATNAAMITSPPPATADEAITIKVTLGSGGKDVKLEQDRDMAHITWNHGAARIPDIDSIKFDRSQMASTKNGSLLLIPFGHNGGGDCLALVTFDKRMHEITSVVDWTPRDSRVEITDWNATDDVVNFSLLTGRHRDIRTQFRVTFREQDDPKWEASACKIYGGMNPLTIELKKGAWTATSGSRTGADLPTYEAYYRKSPSERRPLFRINIPNPNRE